MVLVAVMLVMMAGGVWWAWGWMDQQKASARTAATDLVTCRQYAEAIKALQAEPTVQAADAMGDQELGNRIAAAAAKVGFGPQTVGSVNHLADRRIPNSPFIQKPSFLRIYSVSLGQLASFLYYLTEDSTLNVRDLRIQTPSGNAEQTTWDAEVTVTYLAYEPQEAPRSK